MASWRLAESLKKLREEINEAFPNRSKVSDGSIGDANHSARTSDHNPNDAGVVCAIDVTHDPRSGCTGDKLAAALIKSRDKRIKYLIWNRRIISSYGSQAWKWRPYSGANAHQHHVHISVAEGESLYDSRKDWDLDLDIAVLQSGSQLKADEIPAIQHNAGAAAWAVSPSQPSVENPPLEPGIVQDATPQQTNEAGGSGQQVILQPNSLAPNVPIVPRDADPVKVVASEPEKTGAKKSIWATITAGLAYLALNIETFFAKAYESVKDNPVIALSLICGCLLIILVYWKYQERQTKLDELREKQAHELTLEKMRLAADQQKHTVEVVKPA